MAGRAQKPRPLTACRRHCIRGHQPSGETVRRRRGASEDVKPVVARLVVFGAAVGSLALLAGAVMLVLRMAQPTEYPVDLSRAPDGEIVGRVARVEPGTILVNSEPPGSGAVPVMVTKDTRIMVGSTDGWINDVRPGGQIKVAYDLYEGKKLARSVEVLAEQGARRLAPVEPPPKGAASQKPAELPPAAPPAAATSTLKPVAPAKPTPAPLPQVETPPPAPRAERSRAARSKAPTPTPSTPAPPTPAPQAPDLPAVALPTSPPPAPEAPVRAQEPARPPEPESSDGSAAVDWLLKGRR